MAADLPQEILLNIFSKTPTKSVGRFRSLSKNWNTHLSTSFFIKKHLISRHEEHLALVRQDKTVRIITSPTKNGGEVKSLAGLCFLVKSLAGLCLADLVKGMFKNAVGESHYLQTGYYSTNSRFALSSLYCLWTWYDSCFDDYKIVQISYLSSKKVANGAKTFVDVYSVKNGVWKRVDDCYPYGELLPTTSIGFEDGPFLNGAVHWILSSRYRSCITAFDLANEAFNEIPLPKEFVGDRRRTRGLSVVGGCLSIAYNNGNGTSDIWIMKEYGVAESWSRFRIGDVDKKWHPIYVTLCNGEDGELLCLTSGDYGNYVSACNLKEGTVKGVFGRGFGDSFWHGMSFVDSLVSPEDLPS